MSQDCSCKLSVPWEATVFLTDCYLFLKANVNQILVAMVLWLGVHQQPTNIMWTKKITWEPQIASLAHFSASWDMLCLQKPVQSRNKHLIWIHLSTLASATINLRASVWFKGVWSSFLALIQVVQYWVNWDSWNSCDTISYREETSHYGSCCREHLNPKISFVLSSGYSLYQY